MSAKKSQTVRSSVAAANPIPGTSPLAAPPSSELLLVCLQDPFDAVGDSSVIVHAAVPAASGNPTHQWRLESVMEMNPPRFFESWATRGSFIIDISVSASAQPAAGTWGGTATTLSGSGVCRVTVMRDADDKVHFSLESDARHAPEKPMPQPDDQRFLNADIAFEVNGKTGLTAGAVAVISNKPWSRLIAGSSAATKGLAFDGAWRRNLADGDGDSSVLGTWAFAVMTPIAYQELCISRGWEPYVV